MCAPRSKGMALTFKHMIHPDKVTVQYPEQRDQLSPRWRGTHRMLTTENRKAKCVACGLCPTVCPANCIKLVPGEDEQGNRYPLVFEHRRVPLHFLRVLPGGLPGGGDPLGRHYENSEYSRNGFVYDLERLMAQTHPVCEMWDPPTHRVSRRSNDAVLPLHLLLLRARRRRVGRRVRDRRSPVAAALWLVNVMFCLSALFVMLDAQFIGAIQVLVYAGAIMVVFLFVIMLLNLGQPGQLANAAGWLPRIAAGGLAIAVLAGALVRLPHPEPIATLRLAPDSLAVLTATAGLRSRRSLRRSSRRTSWRSRSPVSCCSQQ